MTTEAFNKKRFFERLIEQLKANGAFDTAETPEGCPYVHPEAAPFHISQAAKPLHFPEGRPATDGIDINTPGTVWHVGDVPYQEDTRVLLKRTRGSYPTQKDAALKMQELRDAFNAYMAEDGFAEYLADFQRNLGRKENHACFTQALENMTSIARKSAFSVSGEALEHALHHPPAKNEKLLDTVLNSAAIRHLYCYPELVTALAIYQAAHIAYQKDLCAAVQSSKSLTQEQRDNALSVVMGKGFAQLKDFNIFNIIMPLVVHAYEHESAEEVPVFPERFGDIVNALRPGVRPISVDAERMDKAIGEAWKNLFKLQMLVARMETNENGKKHVVVACPASAHLLHAMEHRVLEDIYTQTLTPSFHMKPLIEEAKKAAYLVGKGEPVLPSSQVIKRY